MYAIRNNDNHETCHHDFSFQLDYASRDNYFFEFAPTTIHEKDFAYVESNKISMLVDHENNALGAGMVELIHDSTEIITREEHMLVEIAIMSSFLSMC